jgi:hypothetical protein
MQEITYDEQRSPFIGGPPITHPRYFFGRERELKRLFSLWKMPPLQNAAIIGPRRSGKTSLLLYLKNITTTPAEKLRPGQRTDWLPNPESYQWIFVDYQDPRLGSQEGMLRHLLDCMDLPLPRSSAGFAPTAPRRDGMQPSALATTDLGGTMQVPCDLDYFMNVVSENLRTPTVILLDEIDVALQRYSELDDAFWEGLRALASNLVGGNLAFVLASKNPPDQLASNSDIGSPFFNIFGYSATLGPLRDPEARELIAISPIPFSPADIKWIIAQSKCWPLLLQILCRERLVALEEGETSDAWREDGLRQIAPFRHMLEESDLPVDAVPQEHAPSPYELRRLHQILTTRFGGEDLRTLCFYLGVDFDSLKGEGKEGKARELLKHLAHRNRIPELIEIGRQIRPDIQWLDTA